MRTLNKNKQSMWYALKSETELPVYDYYIGEDGKEYPIETGEYDYLYFAPVPFEGNIAMGGGEAEAVAFGLNLADYDAVLIVSKDSLPLTETSVVWQNTEPQPHADGTVDSKTADYTIVKVAPSLNFDRYVLKKVVK